MRWRRRRRCTARRVRRGSYPRGVHEGRTIRRSLPLLVALAATALLLLLPDPVPAGEREPVEAYHGRIVSVLATPTGPSVAPGATLAPEATPELVPLPSAFPTIDPDATLPPDPGEDPGADPPPDPVGDLRVELLDGPRRGEIVEAFAGGPATYVAPTDYAVGDEVIVSFRGDPTGVPFVSVIDRWRVPVLTGLFALFVVAIVVVGGAPGLRALIALALTAALVVKVVVPQVLQGVPPLPLALAVAIVVTVATIGLTEGLHRVSLAAITGTVSALAITGILAALVTELGRFSAAAGEDLVFLQVSGQAFDLRGLLLGAFMLGALGVLDDVTVTQAAAVDELAERTDLRGRALFGSALRIGRAHIAATVNTLFLAYAGASLPLLVLFTVAREPGIATLNSEAVAIEVVRTLVGSLGIVSAVPSTTAVAVWLADRAPTGPSGFEAASLHLGLTRHRD
jgi:uncharacterized membrane protein